MGWTGDNIEGFGAKDWDPADPPRSRWSEQVNPSSIHHWRGHTQQALLQQRLWPGGRLHTEPSKRQSGEIFSNGTSEIIFLQYSEKMFYTSYDLNQNSQPSAEPSTEAIEAHRQKYPKVVINVGGIKHEVMWKLFHKRPLTRLGMLSKVGWWVQRCSLIEIFLF